MQKKEIRELIIRITGPRLTGESMDQWLYRGAGYAGIGFPSFRKAWYGQEIAVGIYTSKKTVQKLEKAARHAQRPQYLLDATRRQIQIWEREPELYQPFINASRHFVGEIERAARELEQAQRELEQADDELEQASICMGDGEGAGEFSTAAAGAASA